MNKHLITLLFAAVMAVSAGIAYASVELSNEDSREYRILIADSDSCFSGTRTYIGGSTTTSVNAGWLCINEEKPGYKMDDGKSYRIKNGRLEAK